MSNLSYYSRLKELHLESLELRRLRTDLLTVYKILFGLLNTSTDVFFTPRGSRALTWSPIHARQAAIRAPRRSRRAAAADVSPARSRFCSIMMLLQVVRLYLPSLVQSSKSASCRRVAGALQVEDISSIKLFTSRLQRKAGPIPPPEMRKLPELL